MATYHIEFEPVLSASARLDQLLADYRRFRTSFSGFTYSGGPDAHASSVIRSRVSRSKADLSRLEGSLSSCAEGLHQIVRSYQRTENLLKHSTIPGVSAAGIIVSMPETQGTFINAVPEPGYSSTDPVPQPGESSTVAAPDTDIVPAASASFDGPSASAQADAASSFTGQDSLAGAHAAAGATAASFVLSDTHPFLDTTMEGSVLHAEASADASFSHHITDDGSRSATRLSSGASAEASVFRMHGSSRLGTNDLALSSEGTAAFGGAKAQASTRLELNENRSAAISGKLEAEAYLAKGEVSLGHQFGGVDITVTAEGMAGVQAELKGEVSTSHVKGKIGLGPVGLGVKIDWKDIH